MRRHRRRCGISGAREGGPSARVEPICRYHQASPDLHLDIDDLIVAGPQGDIPRNRHRRTYGTGPDGTGCGRVVTIMHFEGDKVVREWIGADKLWLFIQLGVLDDPWPN